MDTGGAYSGFAAVYDELMQPPYDDWAVYAEALWLRFGAGKPSLVLDLACGTGNITTRLAKMGYDVIGVDCAEEMLSVAATKNQDILYLCQDMREFELYGTVDAACCLCDGMNYLADENELAQVLSLVRNYLNPGGVFVFDLNTEHYFANVLSGNVFAEASETAAYIWENDYDPETKTNEYAVTFFVQEANGLYRRFEELHNETAFSDEEVRRAAASAGLTVCAAFDGAGFDERNDTTERVYYVMQKNS